VLTDAPDMSMDLAQSARELENLLVQLTVGGGDKTWKDVERTAQILANGLRIRDSPG
jgi:hypothetical protein